MTQSIDQTAPISLPSPPQGQLSPYKQSVIDLATEIYKARRGNVEAIGPDIATNAGAKGFVEGHAHAAIAEAEIFLAVARVWAMK
jgi:hypothetical protein